MASRLSAPPWAKLIIERRAHPAYRDALWDYYERALATAYGRHAQSLPGEALSWRQRFIDTGSMQPAFRADPNQPPKSPGSPAH